MDSLKDLVVGLIENEKLIYGVLSNLRNKNVEFTKVNVKPVLIKNEYMIQIEKSYQNKVLHENLDKKEAINKIYELMETTFKQGVLYCKDADYQILVSKKGKVNVLKKKPTRSEVNLQHNRKKNYIIEDGIPCDFLIRLGVMSNDGKVYKNKYDKFRQINKFLEMVSDTLKKAEVNDSLNIIDFGCGKSYLTFALYYYLVDILNIDVNIIGLDLKKDVINFCNEVARDLKYDNLKFLHGDIKDFNELYKVDMVVTLHACDTATDMAIVKAVNWDANIILSVPCCQHELFNKIENNIMNPLLKHGIIKEKVSSLITDSIRGNVLEILGYSTQILEFVDMEHTPKNILIRAIKSNSKNESCVIEYLKFKEFWNLNNIYLENALGDRFSNLLKDED